MGFLPGKDLTSLVPFKEAGRGGRFLTFTCCILFNLIIAIIIVHELLGDFWFMNND